MLKHTNENVLISRVLPEVWSFHWRKIIIALLMALGYSLTTLVPVPIIAALIEALTGQSSSADTNRIRHIFHIPSRIDETNIEILFVILGVVLLLLIFRSVFNFLRLYYNSEVSYNYCADLRERLYKHVQKLSYSFLDSSRAGDLMQRVTTAITDLQNFMGSSLEDFFVSPILVLSVIVYLALSYPWLMGYMLILLICISLLWNWFSKRLRVATIANQQYQGEMTTYLQEGLSTIRLVQSFCTESKEQLRFNQANRMALAESIRALRLQSGLWTIVDFIGLLGPFAMIALLGYAMLKFHTNIGDLMEVVGMLGMIANPILKISRLASNSLVGRAAADRAFELLDTPIEIFNEPNAIDLSECKGRVVFSDANFSYKIGHPVLKHFNSHIHPGQVIAIVGESGSGKSTILNLIPRFYDLQSGSLLIDGIDIRRIKLESLRSHIGMVQQETILIHGTIRENITYGLSSYSEQDLLNAARAADAHDFILDLKNGYETIVGERGVMLSGGQRQRIAIARVLLKDPKILLLDEATSALDSVTEYSIQQALEKLMYGRTTIIVAHRFSTIQNADRILVLKNGSIVESGTHSELIGFSGEYLRLYKAFSKKD